MLAARGATKPMANGATKPKAKAAKSLDKRAERLASGLADVYSSRSWKVTSPLRATLDWLGKKS